MGAASAVSWSPPLRVAHAPPPAVRVTRWLWGAAGGGGGPRAAPTVGDRDRRLGDGGREAAHTRPAPTRPPVWVGPVRLFFFFCRSFLFLCPGVLSVWWAPAAAASRRTPRRPPYRRPPPPACSALGHHRARSFHSRRRRTPHAVFGARTPCQPFPGRPLSPRRPLSRPLATPRCSLCTTVPTPFCTPSRSLPSPPLSPSVPTNHPPPTPPR